MRALLTLALLMITFPAAAAMTSEAFVESGRALKLGSSSDLVVCIDWRIAPKGRSAGTQNHDGVAPDAS